MALHYTVRGQTTREEAAARGGPRLAFGQEVLAELERGKDIAAEQTWQRFARLVVEHWQTFNAEQSPLATWNMLTRCGEMILKIRQSRSKGADNTDLLADFRALMEAVEGRDG